MSRDILESKEVKLAVLLKTNQIKRDHLSTITLNQVLRTLEHTKWKQKGNYNFNQVIQDIMDLDVSQVVAFLSLDAIRQGSQMGIADMDTYLDPQ